MLSIAGIDHIVLNTTKLQLMLDFYCKVLGCSIEKEQPDLKLTQLRAGACLIDLIETNNEEVSHKNMDHFCLQVKNFNYDEISKLLAAHKIPFSRYGERYGAQGYGYSLFTTDPQGNTVELAQYNASI